MTEPTDFDSDPGPATECRSRARWSHSGLRTLAATLCLLFVATEPALAAESAICSTEKLPTAIEGFFELTTAFGLIGLIVVWQGSSLLGMLTLSPEQKKAIRHYKRDAVRSMVVIFALGPVYTIAGPKMGLPLAECIDMVPW